MAVAKMALRGGASAAMRWLIAAMAALVAVAMSPFALPSGAATASGTPIVVGYVYPETGSLAASYLNAPDGIKAYFDGINKQGGYHGHPLNLVTVDDQSTPTGSQTAVQRLLADNVTYIVNGSPFFFESDKAVQQAGVPVIGQLTDGPEWGQQPFTNMFDLRGGVNSTYTGVADITGATFFKKLGVKKLASLAIGISPSAVATAKVAADAATGLGLDMAFEDLNVPYGPYEPTTDILQMKAAGAQGVFCVCGASTYASLIVGLRNENLKVHPLSFGGADYTLFNSPTTADAVQGIYYNSYFPPENFNAAAKTAEQQMAKVVPGYKVGQVPTYSVAGTYNAGQLALKGLEMTGKSDPTKAEIIAKLQTLKNWNADGLLPSPISFTHFGTSEKEYCAWYVQGDTKTKTFNYINGGKVECTKTPAAYIG